MLLLLDRVEGVPKLLHVDMDAIALIETRMPGQVLDSMSSALMCDPKFAVQIGIACAGTLRDIHATRVFHGALTPRRIVFDGTTGRASLLNFSEAVVQSHVDPDFVHAALLGRVLPFAAPEQTGRMGRAVDYRADLYSLGAVLYWVMTGRAPFIEDEPLALLHALLTSRPASPQSRNLRVPAMLSAIVLKLLAKDPQQRYQSAEGLRLDLVRCAADLELGLAQTFEMGLRDRRIRPAQPSGLIGREAELAQLARALDGSSERCRVVLVRGFSGAGKTALVRGLYPLLSQRNGIFAGGRYDEYQRLTPFSGLAAALSDLAQFWLSESPQDLAALRGELLTALGSNASQLVLLAPAFAPLLWPGQNRSEPTDSTLTHTLPRMQRALAAVFQVIRLRSTPLVLFIDNLQWADAGSLEIFESAAMHESTAPVLLVGAYRSNEVNGSHPLDAVLAHIRGSGTEVLDVVADSLGEAAVHDLVVDVLIGASAVADRNEAIKPLAQVLHRRTEGNPFFVLQYLRRLFDEGHLRPNGDGWEVDNHAVDALPGSDSLVHALVEELRYLPPLVLRLAGLAACLGAVVDVELF